MKGGVRQAWPSCRSRNPLSWRCRRGRGGYCGLTRDEPRGEGGEERTVKRKRVHLHKNDLEMEEK